MSRRRRRKRGDTRGKEQLKHGRKSQDEGKMERLKKEKESVLRSREGGWKRRSDPGKDDECQCCLRQIRAPALAFQKPFQKTFSKRVAWPFSAAVVGRQKTTMTPRTQKKKKEKLRREVTEARGASHCWHPGLIVSEPAEERAETRGAVLKKELN